MSLVFANVTKDIVSRQQTLRIIDKVSFAVEPGEFVCLLGPSGCGKSTLLSLAAGLEKPSQGSVSWQGKGISAPGPDKAILLQEPALFPWLTVRENVEFPLKMAGVDKKQRQIKADHFLKLIHLSEFAEALIHQLSGGMRQRVALARALAVDAGLLLMDEPFASLDSQTKDMLHRELQRIWWETKKSIVFVTHDVKEAVLLGDRVLIMSAAPGSVIHEIKVQLARPRSLEDLDVARLSAQINVILGGEVEKVAKNEYDHNWDLAQDTILHGPDYYMGIGL